MQAARPWAVLFAWLTTCWAADLETNPLEKVLTLINELSAEIKSEGEEADKTYEEYVSWCEDMARTAHNGIKTATTKKGKLEAKIGELTSSIDSASTKIEDLASAISTATADLKSATKIREKENADFVASEKELVESVDMLERAISIIEKEMAKNPASFAQLDQTNMRNMLQSLSLVIDAAGFSVTDQKKLLSLAQSQESDEEEDESGAMGAPAAAAYKSKSGGIVDVLDEMKGKAETQLSELRKDEVKAAQNFEMLKQSLEAQIAADKKDMAEEKAAKAEAEEEKAAAEGELEKTNKLLSSTSEELETASATCMQTATDHEATIKARTEELKVVAEARKILAETSSGAGGQAYSLLQVGQRARMATKTDLKGQEVVVLVKKLARQQHSAALAQLASRLAAIAQYGAANGADPFVKIRGLIQDMIEKLEREAEEDATEKAFCDEEMGKTGAKKSDLEDDMEKLTAKLDKSSAKTADLKEEVKGLESELAAMAKEQAEMDQIRQKTHKEYTAAKKDLELGLGGVRKALTLLREYYQKKESEASMIQTDESSDSQQPEMPKPHKKSGSAATGIIGILETVENDFATTLAKEETEEADAQAEYEKMTQENKIMKMQMEKDVEYDAQEIKSLEKTMAELSADKESTGTELSAVMDYWNKLSERCVAKPISYEERKKRRDAEIKGLKEALDILEEETAFMQRKRRGGNMRGSLTAR